MVGIGNVNGSSSRLVSGVGLWYFLIKRTCFLEQMNCNFLLIFFYDITRSSSFSCACNIYLNSFIDTQHSKKHSVLVYVKPFHNTHQDSATTRFRNGCKEFRMISTFFSYTTYGFFLSLCYNTPNSRKCEPPKRSVHNGRTQVYSFILFGARICFLVVLSSCTKMLIDMGNHCP